MSEEECPECGEDLDYDEVDIGVGVQRGNFYCPHCGWSPAEYGEDSETVMLPHPKDGEN